ncbi:hypothetical protein Mycch_5902 (plasmid) [Mycolicibacterium chubuense NBB4]|uniref:Fenitrothion hydrolase n=2 Tax=Mycolicibacterium TaxID=1866885 RepID=D2K2C7_MYCCN|nr:hypothetical protein [Mycolicibacterium chubuense]ACZ56333.1 conserved hypothetical protein [Mycolicibacterium chubuense NBB4]AFM20511.1 hypothetical protein Mycch_5902 [Mycolicibacterium chubuense NBB4]NTY63979.1 hypothetical protein [Mycolicibacterium sphagni]
MTDTSVQVLAHGLGGSADLPVPLAYALVAAAWALSISFAVLVFAWRTPRLRADAPGVPLPGWVNTFAASPLVRRVLAGTGLALTVWLLLAGAFGPPQTSHNALPTTFYTLLWVGLVAASVLFGPVWKLISPVRAVRRLVCLATGQRPAQGWVAYPEKLGYWPAAIGLLAFVWLELTSPNPGSVTAVLTWSVAYLMITIAGATVCGTRWCERADPFEVYSSLVGRLSPVGPGQEPGTYVLRWPLNNLQATKVGVGSVAVATVLLGSTAFDSFSAQPRWRNFVDSVSASELLGSWTATAVRSGGLLMMVLFVALTFTLACRAVPQLPRSERAKLPCLLVPSLTPIIVGYIFAHYLTFLVEKGQSAAMLLLDPFDFGWNPLGLAHRDVAYVLSTHPTVLASLKVTSVIVGHILGVLAAHDRSLRVLPKRHQLTGQLALLFTMIMYTCGGLYLLFGG